MSRVRRSARHSKDDTEKRETGHAPAGTRSPALLVFLVAIGGLTESIVPEAVDRSV
jgi:hypothetical protein